MNKYNIFLVCGATFAASFIAVACSTNPGNPIIPAPTDVFILRNTPAPVDGYTYAGMTSSPTSGNTWQTRARMTFPRSHFAAAEVNGKIYVAGGITNNPPTPGVLDRLEVYDPATDTWNSLPNLPTKRWDFAGAAANGKFYAIGGRPAAGGLSSVVEEYDPTTNSWRGMTKMIAPRAAFGAATVDNKIYVICGEGSNTVEVFDPNANTWAAKLSVPSPPDATWSGGGKRPYLLAVWIWWAQWWVKCSLCIRSRAKCFYTAEPNAHGARLSGGRGGGRYCVCLRRI